MHSRRVLPASLLASTQPHGAVTCTALEPLILPQVHFNPSLCPAPAWFA